MRNFIRKYILPYIPTLKIKSTARIGMDFELNKQFKRLKPGIVLDVGSEYSPYKNKIPYKKYMRLDVNKKTKPDICCDIHKIKWKSNYFDTIIATEVLEHLYDPQKVVDELYRILKSGGICIASTRFIQMYHPMPKDYYRFTWDSLNYLFKKFKKVEIYHHGNKLQMLWHMFNSEKTRMLLNIFNPLFARIKTKKTRFPLGFVVYAEK